jgi:peptidoglycan/LPS O-acetylase OafA/YrhL
MSSTVNKQERFHFLDGFRGVAIAMIVLAHAFMSHIIRLIMTLKIPFFSHLFSDFISAGLVLFFVLSGMVILRPYLRKERSFKFGPYWKRRFERLYPPFFFALLFGAFVVWFNSAFPTWYNVKGLRMRFTWWELFKESPATTSTLPGGA